MPAENVEAVALSMGWKPLEQFSGDHSKWVDAETFVSRGEHFLPIVRADRDRLRAQVEETTSKLEETRRLFQASQEAIEELKKFQDENTKRQVAEARRALIKELKEARENNDVDAEVRAQSEIVRLDAAAAAAPAAAPAPAPAATPPNPELDPEYLAWERDNPWFKEDIRKHSLALGIAQDMRRPDSPDRHLKGRAFFDRITEEVNAIFSPQGRATSKVAAGRPAGGSGGSARTRTYDDLPSEAKAACATYERKLVGPGRAYKTADEWRSHYANQYFNGEEA